jgi:hypothetical protein
LDLNAPASLHKNVVVYHPVDDYVIWNKMNFLGFTMTLTDKADI